MTEEQKKQAATDRWMKAAHAMQSGVAATMQIEATDTTPKHLRVGVNAAMANLGSLARLLIAKGLFTELEYLEAIADGMEQEVKSYEEKLSKHHNVKITLA